METEGGTQKRRERAKSEVCTMVGPSIRNESTLDNIFLTAAYLVSHPLANLSQDTTEETKCLEELNPQHIFYH